MKIKAGIIGGTGYVAGELLRILILHPNVNIDFVYSSSAAGKNINVIHQDLFFEKDLKFSNSINENSDVVFLSLGHGNSSKFLNKYNFASHTKIIDLSQDFRLKNHTSSHKNTFIYGLTAINSEKIKDAANIANPGCFATAIELALLPLAKKNLLNKPIHIHGVTGSTGAGKNLSETSHFSWRNNNISVYKPFEHQHIAEIKETLQAFQPDMNNEINFIPLRGNFSRGIIITAYMDCDIDEKTLNDIYVQFYKSIPFIEISKTTIHLKQVVNTNYALIHTEKNQNKAFIVVVIDNLLKGAAGQAVENMNLMFGLDHEAGLNFKASYF